MDQYRKRLWKAVTHALGLYMGFRVNGLDGGVQLKRYKILAAKLEEYDRNLKGEIMDKQDETV